MLVKERVLEFLASLNKELDEVCGLVLGKEPLPSTREVFSEVWGEGSRRIVMMDKTKPTMVSKNFALCVSTMEGLSTKVGITTVSQRKKFNEQERWCDFCNRLRHAMETYWKLHDQPTNWKRQKPEERTQGMRPLAKTQK